MTDDDPTGLGVPAGDETYGEWTGAPMPGGGAGASDAAGGAPTPATGATAEEAVAAAEAAGADTPPCS